MHCEECGKRPATLHLTKIVNGEKTEMHLCEYCAQEKGDFFSHAANSFSFHNLLSGLMSFDSNSSLATGEVQSSLHCKTCGMTYNQFIKSGRFGCSDCYHHFNSRLDPLFRRIHGNTAHSGKVPVRTGGHIKQKRQLEQLRQDLQRCITAEEFERAAKIRDQIRELEQQMANG